MSDVLDAASFRSADGIDDLVPRDFGVYAIRLEPSASLPEPFGAHLATRATRLIYIGQAREQTLQQRLLGNELRARGNGTFIRSIGAVLGFRPPWASGSRSRGSNYRFSIEDRQRIVRWIDANLEVGWSVLPRQEIQQVEVALIRDHSPLLNLQHNTRALRELQVLRARCRADSAGPGAASS